MKLVLLLYIAVVLCNPSTTLYEAGIIYLAYSGMQKAGIDTILVGDTEIKIIKKVESIQDFLKETSEVIIKNYNNMDFTNVKIEDWQTKFDKAEDAVNKYIEGHPSYVTKIKGKSYLVIKGSEPKFHFKMV